MFRLTVKLILLITTIFLQILGFLKLIPLYISSPLLLLVLFIILHSLNNRKRFKGFK